MNSTMRITPSTQDTLKAFCKMILDRTTIDKPFVEMNEETSRNIEIIWKSIAALAPQWRGNRELIIPDAPTNRKEFWGKIAACHPHPPKDLRVAFEFIEQASSAGKFAIDLGCGNSPATKQLLEKGWRVLAVDYSRQALDVLQTQCQKAVASGQLTVVEADINTFVSPEPADLVIAANIFPYIDPAKFQATWQKIHDTCLKKNGFLIGSFFHSVPSEFQDMNFLKEWGAWFLPDRRMARSLITHSGYEIHKCVFKISLQGKKPICIDFIAKKPSSEAKE